MDETTGSKGPSGTESNEPEQDRRVTIKKTYKLYVDGEFPRTESGRSIKVNYSDGTFATNVSRASRKDLREAVTAARGALNDWSGRTAFNRGQILYRMAEMLESRKPGMVEHLVDLAGHSRAEARREVKTSIDRLVWYAGWADKFEQVFGSTNPVASDHFNFTTVEPTGVIAGFLPENAPLLGVVSGIAPVITAGNTFIGIVGDNAPTVAMEFAEVLNNSDLPGGVVNLLTGYRDELLGHVGGHRDVDGIVSYGASDEEKKKLTLEGAESVTRVEFEDDPEDWTDDSLRSPYRILPFVEFKTAWHPTGK
ncbi:MAG: aldehyde dehydrogenase family protein [bacterium]